MPTLSEVYETILSLASPPGSKPPNPVCLAFSQNRHDVVLHCGALGRQAQVVLDPSAVAPLLRAFANRDDDNPNLGATSTGELYSRLCLINAYPVYPTTPILEQMRRSVARRGKRRTPDHKLVFVNDATPSSN